MAGVKISALTPVASAQTTDTLPVVQGGQTKKETLSQVITLFNGQIQLASTSQVTGLNTLLATYLPLAGGNMTGDIDMGAHFITQLLDPVNPQDACTKNYADSIAGGLQIVLACDVATTANLNATQAGAGVGATLTNAGAQVALAIDGVTLSVGNRVLVKDQTLTQHCGIYTVTDTGSGVTNWVLTRATDYDTNTQIVPGTLIAVNSGTVNTNTSWLETATVVTVDTDPVLFSQFTYNPATFLKVANNLSDVANAATSRTNLGLGTAATKAASDNGQATVASVTGATVVGNLSSFADITGTVQDSGLPSTSTGTGSLVRATSPTLVTPNLGVATATSLAFSPSTNGIVGTTTNNNASSGYVGEYVDSVIAAGSAVALVTTVAKTVTSITLTPGDYDVWGELALNAAGTTNIYSISGGISLTNNTMPTFPSSNGSFTKITSPYNSANSTATYWYPANNSSPSLALVPCRISIAVNTTVYLVAAVAFTVSTCSAYGKICARRVR